MQRAESMAPVNEELAGKCVFVTGGSGFMGKVLLEKLLRSCPDIACIYVLLRPKKGVQIQERLKAIVKTPVSSPKEQYFGYNVCCTKVEGGGEGQIIAYNAIVKIIYSP